MEQLIGRQTELNKLHELYNSEYIINIYGPPLSGKSTLITSFLRNAGTCFKIDFNDINWNSVESTYLYLKNILYSSLEVENIDIVDLSFLFNTSITNMSKLDDEYVLVSNCDIFKLPIIWLEHCESLFLEDFSDFNCGLKYLFWIWINTLYKLKLCKFILSISNGMFDSTSASNIGKDILSNMISFELTYLSLTDSKLYWTQLCGKQMDENIFNITGGDPVALKILSETSLNSFIQKYIKILLKIKKLFGDDLYRLFISNKGIVKTSLLIHYNTNMIMNSPYVYITHEHIKLSPPLIYILFTS